ncbi:MAG: MBL fold metallo-hydrolase RNA specificity domain-containing protein [archaeon]
MIEIIPIGGYSEIGRNCTLIKVDNEAVIIDMGLHLENYIKFTEDEDVEGFLSPKDLMDVGAIPDVRPFLKYKDMVKAICITHAHLDHVGGVPYLANKFNCGVHGTAFTIEVLRQILKDEKMKLKNDLVVHKTDSTFKVSKNITIEFINMTHSVPQTVMIAVHTKEGTVLYANDFKFDSAPVLGKKPNFDRLKELKVKALILDSLYAPYDKKTPSESIAREMLKDVLLGVDSKGHSVIVTTFSSHIARLKSIIEIGQKLNRKIVFCGRSLNKYVTAAENIGLVKFTDKIQMVKYGSKVQTFFKGIKHPEKYLFVVTGHQGEPKATLAKMVYRKYFKFMPDDQIIFSCTVIPTPITKQNRAELESALRSLKVRMFKDIHVSGHACREDLRDFINMVKPQHIFPAHGDKHMVEALRDLALEMGYKVDQIHILHNRQKFNVK